MGKERLFEPCIKIECYRDYEWWQGLALLSAHEPTKQACNRAERGLMMVDVCEVCPMYNRDDLVCDSESLRVETVTPRAGLCGKDNGHKGLIWDPRTLASKGLSTHAFWTGRF
ncbi:hypothetical protein GOP47_0014135 [Adiantum capillus-veneris]|uniref:Uncharacterized protein n=1 Tax=Adiantum capillus-veneris TaxID=13818 RepID=A0A9D4UPV2_ADICA|nr:hypothetical protein GOP47_0014135 [Adiantum capillus-veneris]